jgi:hypothetical protein
MFLLVVLITVCADLRNTHLSILLDVYYSVLFTYPTVFIYVINVELRRDSVVGISDWLRAGRLRGWSSSPGRVKNFEFFMSSRPALGPTHLPI